MAIKETLGRIMFPEESFERDVQEEIRSGRGDPEEIKFYEGLNALGAVFRGFILQIGLALPLGLNHTAAECESKSADLAILTIIPLSVLNYKRRVDEVLGGL